MPRSAMRANQPAQRILVAAHQARGRLIEQQHAWTHGERACDLDQAAVDMRQVAGRRGERTVIAHERQQRFRGAAIVRDAAVAPGIAEPAAAERDEDVVGTLMVPNSCVVW